MQENFFKTILYKKMELLVTTFQFGFNGVSKCFLNCFPASDGTSQMQCKNEFFINRIAIQTFFDYDKF